MCCGSRLLRHLFIWNLETDIADADLGALVHLDPLGTMQRRGTVSVDRQAMAAPLLSLELRLMRQSRASTISESPRMTPPEVLRIRQALILQHE